MGNKKMVGERREEVVLDFLYGGGLVAGEDDWREKAAG